MKRSLILTILPFLYQSFSFAGVIEPRVTWNKKTIVTCFYTHSSQLKLTDLLSKKNTENKYKFTPNELTKDQKEKVKNIIQREFSSRRTKIHFTGFKDCHQVANPDLIVMDIKSTGLFGLGNSSGVSARTVIGQAGQFGTYRGSKGYFTKSGKVSYTALNHYNAGVIVHEFGHVAGLRHEEARPERKNDNNCRWASGSFDSGERVLDTANLETNYDAKSIMNTCYLNTNRNKFESKIGNLLSEGDVFTLRQHY
jgi:hypothetical protein